MNDMNNMKLCDTVDMMLSDDYKERFKAEYYQVLIRAEKLDEMLRSWDKLKFTPTCSKETYEKQFRAMIQYLDILNERALKEGVKFE